MPHLSCLVFSRQEFSFVAQAGLETPTLPALVSEVLNLQVCAVTSFLFLPPETCGVNYFPQSIPLTGLLAPELVCSGSKDGGAVPALSCPTRGVLVSLQIDAPSLPFWGWEKHRILA